MFAFIVSHTLVYLLSAFVGQHNKITVCGLGGHVGSGSGNVVGKMTVKESGKNYDLNLGHSHDSTVACNLIFF